LLNSRHKSQSLTPALLASVAFCERFSLSRRRLLHGTGLEPIDLHNSQLAISFEQQRRLFKTISQLRPEPDSAFILAEHLLYEQANLLASLSNSNRLGQALRILNAHCFRYSPLMLAQSFITAQRVEIYYSPMFDIPSAHSQFMAEFQSYLLAHTLKRLTGHWVKSWFNFSHARPKNVMEYEQRLGTRLQFNQPAFSVVFEKKWLNFKFSEVNTWRARRVISEYQKRDDGLPTTPQLIMQLIRNERFSNLEQVADLLGMSKATVKRKLSDYGLSFQGLHDSVRKHQALHWLQQPGYSNEQVAEYLQYSDVTNFRRAVKRWTGYTPSQIKQLLVSWT